MQNQPRATVVLGISKCRIGSPQFFAALRTLGIGPVFIFPPATMESIGKRKK